MDGNTAVAQIVTKTATVDCGCRLWRRHMERRLTRAENNARSVETCRQWVMRAGVGCRDRHTARDMTSPPSSLLQALRPAKHPSTTTLP